MGRTSITLDEAEKKWINDHYGGVSSFVSRMVRQEQTREKNIDTDTAIPSLEHTNVRPAPRGEFPQKTGGLWVENEREVAERPIRVNAIVELAVQYHVPPDVTKAELHDAAVAQAFEAVEDIADVRYTNFAVDNPHAGKDCAGEDCEHRFHREEFPRTVEVEDSYKPVPMCDDCYEEYEEVTA